MQKSNSYFHLSFLILILFSIFLSHSNKLLYFGLSQGSLMKLFFYSYIYICLFYLPYRSFKNLDKFYGGGIRIIFYAILVLGFFQILRSINQISLYRSIFGNPYFGPIFLFPLFSAVHLLLVANVSLCPLAQ